MPVRDGADVLPACLDALAAQTFAAYDVVVVDNGSTDATGDIARRHPLRPMVVTEARPGSYAARNAGAAVAGGATLAFTDADCLPDPGWLTAGVEALTRTGADLVGGDIVPAASETPTVWERYDRAMYLQQGELITHAAFAATANLFVRRTAFDRIGGFDPTLRSSGDLDFGRRAAAVGLRLVHEPAAVVRHRPRTSWRATWALHRRLGAGWGVLAARGDLAPMWRDPAMRVRLGTVVDRVAADGPPLRRRHLAPVHALAMSARVVGRVTRR